MPVFGTQRLVQRFLAIILCLVSVGLIATNAEAADANRTMMFAATPGLVAVVDGCADCTVISGTGVITDETPDQLRSFLNRWQGDPSHTVLRLQSRGGHLMAALKLGRMIRELGMATEVIGSGACQSACVYAFMGGVQRHASDRALGVHNAYFGHLSERAGQISLQPVSVRQDNKARQTAMIISAILKQYLAELNGSTSLLELVRKTPSNQMVYLSQAEMRQHHLLRH